MRALLAEAALQGVSLVVLDPSRFDTEKQMVLTGYWTGTSWQHALQPLPDVVFIINSPIRDEHAPLHDMILRFCRVIADEGGNKLDLANIMAGSAARPYLPITQIIPKDTPAEMIADFLRSNQEAVIKRVSGNQGKGLFFLMSDADQGSYVARYDTKSFRGTLEQVSQFVAQRISGRLRYRDYLAQQFIRSVASDGRPCDIRVHMQRQATGTWGVTRAYVRLAEVGMPLANSSKGGYQGPLDGFLQQRKKRPADEIKAELLQASLLIAEVEDAHQTHALSELGLDFLIDDDDRIWLIETNTFPQSSLHEHARAQHFIGYTKWLAQDRNNTPERRLARDDALCKQDRNFGQGDRP